MAVGTPEGGDLFASATAKAQARVQELSNKAQGVVATELNSFAAKAKAPVIKGLLGRDLIFALVVFGVVATLTGATIALAEISSPAIAAVTMGLAVLALVGTAVGIILRQPR